MIDNDAGPRAAFFKQIIASGNRCGNDLCYNNGKSVVFANLLFTPLCNSDNLWPLNEGGLPVHIKVGASHPT